MKTTQITGWNGVSIREISTAALKDILRFKELKAIKIAEEITDVKEELKKRGE